MATLSPETWARVRYEYEHTRRTIEDICLAHGISAGTLRDRMRRWGWRRRRGPVPAQGPAAPTIPLLEFLPGEQASEGRPDEAARNPGPASPQEAPHSAPLHAGYQPSGDPAASAPALHDPDLKTMTARLAPAIQTAIARLAAASQPRELEQTARALTALLRSLRELNALTAEQRTAAQDDSMPDDPPPDDIDAFRRELARRIDAFVAGRETSET
ncbi:MAG: hypothetical protein AB7O50_07770 [Pseudolabrys sp.]